MFSFCFVRWIENGQSFLRRQRRLCTSMEKIFPRSPRAEVVVSVPSRPLLWMYVHAYIHFWDAWFLAILKHTSDGHSSINWTLCAGNGKAAVEGEREIIFMCARHLRNPPSRTISFAWKLLEILCASLKQYEREDRSVSNNDDVVHVLDKAGRRQGKASAMYESGGPAGRRARKVRKATVGRGTMMMLL